MLCKIHTIYVNLSYGAKHQKLSKNSDFETQKILGVFGSEIGGILKRFQNFRNFEIFLEFSEKVVL